RARVPGFRQQPSFVLRPGGLGELQEMMADVADQYAFITDLDGRLFDDLSIEGGSKRAVWMRHIADLIGGKVVEQNGAEFVLRGIGLVTSSGDLELVTVKAVEGTPVYLKDIATVQIGGDFRRGALDLNGHEAVGGTVVMRTGENAK